MKHLATSLLFVAAACAPATTPSSSRPDDSVLGLRAPAPAPAAPSTPSAEADEFDLGGVLVPNPKAIGRGKLAVEPRSRSLVTAATKTPTNLGGRADTLAMLSAGQIKQVGLRRLARAYPVPGVAGMYTITLNNTGSGWQETFLLQVPAVPSTTPAPLLVCFHKFGVSQNDILTRTTFFQEAQARNWFCIAPLGAAQVSFSSLESQVNVRAAIDYVTGAFTIDRARVYGVGFSMGGGSVTSYAARHLDPNGVMFAAIANHTGGVALPHTYANEADDDDSDDNIPNFGDHLEVPDILDFWYGGTPTLNPFAYLRCSMMDLDATTGTVAPDTDMARNLAHVPILNWLAAGDPMVYLYEQTDEFQKHVEHQNTQNTLVIAPGTVHSWNTLDETAVCNWLAQFTLQLPTQGRLLADQDGTWLRFQVTQDHGGDFTPFDWTATAVTNRLQLSGTRNLRSLTVDAAGLGLSTTAPLTVQLATLDATGDEIVLTGYAQAPSSVLRDGQPASSTFDAQLHTLRLTETDGATHVWTIAP